MQISPDEILQDLGTPEYAQYTVADPVEIGAILAELNARRVRVDVYFNAQPGSITSLILDVAVSRKRLTFDVDTDGRRNEALIRADALAWRTSLNGIKIEFTTGPGESIKLGGKPAFETGFPDVLLRLQRRNAFRTAPSLSQPLIALIDPIGSGDAKLRAKVLDLSCLGVCLLVDTREGNWIGGTRLADCRIELPNYGEIRCSVEVRYLLSAGGKHPDHVRRCGMQFAHLSAGDSIRISRYINDVQRERAKSRLG